MKKYTETHEWIDQDGNLGVTSYAQKELGDIVYVEFPKVGTVVKAGDIITVLESTKAAADIYTPVDGTIVEINEMVKENPSLINESAEEKGWLVRLKITSPKQMDNLHDLSSYLSMVNS